MAVSLHVTLRERVTQKRRVTVAVLRVGSSGGDVRRGELRDRVLQNITDESVFDMRGADRENRSGPITSRGRFAPMARRARAAHAG